MPCTPKKTYHQPTTDVVQYLSDNLMFNVSNNLNISVDNTEGVQYPQSEKLQHAADAEADPVHRQNRTVCQLILLIDLIRS